MVRKYTHNNLTHYQYCTIKKINKNITSHKSKSNINLIKVEKTYIYIPTKDTDLSCLMIRKVGKNSAPELVNMGETVPNLSFMFNRDKTHKLYTCK